MSYSKVQLVEATRLVDISASNQTLPFYPSCKMVIYGILGVATEAYGTIDTGTITLDVGGSVLSTITPVTSDAVGKVRQGTNMVPVTVTSSSTVNIKTTTDGSQAGTEIVYLLCDIFPGIAAA
jgi:hypothetical protein